MHAVQAVKEVLSVLKYLKRAALMWPHREKKHSTYIKRFPKRGSERGN